MKQEISKYKTLILIPTYNLRAYTQALVESIKLKEDQILLIIDNGSSDDTPFYIEAKATQKGISAMSLTENIGAAGSWNLGLKMAFEEYKCDRAVILNNDILVNENTIETMIKDLERPNVGISSAVNVSGECADCREYRKHAPKKGAYYKETPNFSCFAISKKCVEKVGFFDDSFYPAYFEDNDYHFRMRGEDIIAECNYRNGFFHFGSRTKQHSKAFQDYMKIMYMDNREYYIEKWGGLPGFETYTVPFGGLDRTIKSVKQFKDYKNEMRALERS